MITDVSINLWVSDFDLSFTSVSTKLVFGREIETYQKPYILTSSLFKTYQTIGLPWIIMVLQRFTAWSVLQTLFNRSAELSC